MQMRLLRGAVLADPVKPVAFTVPGHAIWVCTSDRTRATSRWDLSAPIAIRLRNMSAEIGLWWALFSWKLGAVATGYDVVEFDGNRIRAVVGFFA